MISAQWATNRWGTKYRYYRCSKKRGRCGQSYVQEKDLAEQVRARLQTISLCDTYTNWMLDKVKEWEREEVSQSQSEFQNLSANIKVSEARLEKLVSVYLDGDVSKEIYLKKKDEVMRATLTLQERMKDFESGRNKWVEPLREWILDTKQADFLSSSDNFAEIASFTKKVGTNPIVRDKSARFGVCAPSAFVADRRRILLALPRPARSRSDLTEQEVSLCGPSRARTVVGQAGYSGFTAHKSFSWTRLVRFKK